MSVRLINETGVPVNYQAIGETEREIVSGQANVLLEGLETSLTVTFNREDDGMVTAMAEASEQSGVLEIRLEETIDADRERQSLRVQVKRTEKLISNRIAVEIN